MNELKSAHWLIRKAAIHARWLLKTGCCESGWSSLSLEGAAGQELLHARFGFLFSLEGASAMSVDKLQAVACCH